MPGQLSESYLSISYHLFYAVPQSVKRTGSKRLNLFEWQ